MKRRKIVIGNWKMNPESLKDAKKLHDSIKKNLSKIKKTIAVICPPSIFMASIRGKTSSKKLFYGVQDVSKEKKGSYTGEMSALMAQSAGALFAIVGHSERRKIGETDEDVSKKVALLLEAKIHPVVCVGEEEVDDNGKYLTFIKRQLAGSLAGVSSADIGRVIIAYEPVYAVGAKDPVTSYTIHQRHLFIRKVLAEIYGKTKAFETLILYGGSVKASNAAELVEGGEVDGLLVGRASLDADEFIGILKQLDHDTKY